MPKQSDPTKTGIKDTGIKVFIPGLSPRADGNTAIDHDAAERWAIEQEAMPANNLSTKPEIEVRNGVDLARPLAPFVWLSRSFGLIHGRALAMSGFGDAAKSWACMELLLAVAAGEPSAMGGVPLDVSGPVLHVDYEQGWVHTTMRYQRIAAGRRIDLAGLAARLEVVSGLAEDRDRRVPFLHQEGAEGALVKLARGKSVVLIDNFAAACGGSMDMNKSSAAEVPYLLNRVSAATGAAVLLIAHETKPSPDRDGARTKGQRMMGSAQIHAALGGGLGFTKLDGGVIRVEQTKETNGEAPEPVHFRLVDDGPVSPITGKREIIRLEWVPQEEAAERAETVKKAKAAPAKGMLRDVLAFVVKHGPCSGNQVRLGIEGTNTEKDAALRQLVQDGRVVSAPGLRNAVLFRAV